jgi:predicted Ser/Thr protein kinase
MTNQKQCTACGSLLAADAPQGLCPACLFKRGLESDPDATEDAGRQAVGEALPPEELAAHFPDLEILELLGRGGMGIVYKARQKQLGRIVALKILSPTVAQDPAFAERFSREARALAMLNHPHIVAVYDFGRKDDLFYFLMEYVDGANLRQVLDGGRLAPREALAIVPQICDALQYAHDNGVVHRDIKPENLLLDRRGRVKIADFGLAKLAGRQPHDVTLTGTGQVMGTLHYMAPEQTEHPQLVDHRADIYSLGVVFYQMLTGELPLGRFAPPSRKVEIDVRLDEVVLRALEKEPALRYQHASEIKTRVESIATSEPGKGPEPEPPAVAPADLDKARRDVRLPAIGLLVVGIVNFLAVSVAGAAWGLLAQYAAAKAASQSPLTAAEAFTASPDIQGVLLLVLFAGLIASSLTMFGALTMMRLEGYGTAVMASILGIVISPGNLVGLPIGIWALVVLSSRHVRAAFAAIGPSTSLGGSESSPPLWSRGDLAVRWTARVLGLLGFLFVLMFILAEGVPAFWSQPLPVQIELAGMVAMMVGLLVGWRLERLGAALIVAGWLVFAILEHGRPPAPFTAFLAIAALYAYSGWRRGKWGTRASLSAATSDVPPKQPAFGSVPPAKGQALEGAGLPEPTTARLSRVAVAGAAWAPLFLLIIVSSVVTIPVPVEAGAEPPGMAWWQIALAVILLPLGLMAPLGTTICGAVSLSQIRHSRGRLYGLGVAIFDLLLYPLLVLNGAIGMVVFAVFHEIALMFGGEHAKPVVYLPLGVTLLLCAVVDAVIIWLVWRAARAKPEERR